MCAGVPYPAPATTLDAALAVDAARRRLDRACNAVDDIAIPIEYRARLIVSSHHPLIGVTVVLVSVSVQRLQCVSLLDRYGDAMPPTVLTTLKITHAAKALRQIDSAAVG